MNLGWGSPSSKRRYLLTQAECEEKGKGEHNTSLKSSDKLEEKWVNISGACMQLDFEKGIDEWS